MISANRLMRCHPPAGSTNIIVTQPRRIAATALAERVAVERGETLGQGAVGYQVRLERVASASACLVFVTTGILLRRLHLDPELEGVSHVVVRRVGFEPTWPQPCKT